MFHRVGLGRTGKAAVHKKGSRDQLLAYTSISESRSLGWRLAAAPARLLEAGGAFETDLIYSANLKEPLAVPCISDTAPTRTGPKTSASPIPLRRHWAAWTN